MAVTSSNLWDKIDKPQYGGKLVIRANRNIDNFDPHVNQFLTSIYGGWRERLVSNDWMLDPMICDYKRAWHFCKVFVFALSLMQQMLFSLSNLGSRVMTVKSALTDLGWRFWYVKFVLGSVMDSPESEKVNETLASFSRL